MPRPPRLFRRARALRLGARARLLCLARAPLTLRLRTRLLLRLLARALGLLSLLLGLLVGTQGLLVLPRPLCPLRLARLQAV